MSYLNCPFYREPPDRILPYVGQTVIAVIEGYGQVRAFILGLKDGNTIVQLLVQTPWGGQQYLEVYVLDIKAISPVITGSGGIGGEFYRQPDGSTGTTHFILPAQYVGKTVDTYIKGYGRIRAYILGVKPDGMVQMLILTPWGGQQYHEAWPYEMIGISLVIPGAEGSISGGPSQGEWPGQGRDQD